VAWLLCLVSVVFGVLQMMAITGALVPPDGRFTALNSVPVNARVFGAVQIIAFMLGIGAMIVFAWRGAGPSGRAGPAVTGALRPHPGPADGQPGQAARKAVR
jgi:hypothetical protein